MRARLVSRQVSTFEYIPELVMEPRTKDLNRDGQPNPAFNEKRREDRAIDELIGLARGVLADGEVVLPEADFLLSWLQGVREFWELWPFSALVPRLRVMLADRVLDAAETDELLALLHDLSGGKKVIEDVASMATALPLDNPAPKIVFSGRGFCLTGKFVTGTRSKCEAAIVDRGGFTKSTPTLDTSFLVIGLIGSRDWAHSTHGRKIEQAIEYRSAGRSIRIVSEEHWSKFLTAGPP